MKSLFKKNMGVIDRILRICAGITFFILGVFIVAGTTGNILLILSLPLLLTGTTGIFPTYSLFGISTKKIETCC